ncbi:MAG: ABC transporter permease [Bacteriovoracaceae bacterium]|nr:ABC transporter permease [Bacteriovoracaceae bacterium]
MKIFLRQLISLTFANMKARYRKTIAGFIWVILNPIILYSVQSVVFRKILRIDVPDYALFLMGGLLPWIFITNTLEMSIPYLYNSHNLLRGFRINPFLLILCQVLDNFFNFIVAFLVILIPVTLFSTYTHSAFYLLPLPILVLLIGIASISSLASLMNVFYRDTKFVLTFVLNIMYFITPIFYPVEFVPEKYRWVIDLNPLFYLIEAFRNAVYGYSPELFWPALAKAALVSTGLAVISYLYWSRRKNDLYYYI